MVDTATTSQSDHPVTEVTTECGPMGEPINGDTGQTTDLTGNSDNYTDPSPRMILEEFFTIVRDVKTLTRKLGKNKSKAIRSMGRHRLAAVRGAREEKRVEGQRERRRVMTSPTLRHKILHGLSLYRLLTDTSVRQVDGYHTPIVRSHLTPIPCKRRQLIGAATRLKLDVAQGMALALEVPLATNHTEPDEHLNLVRDYQVELHTKLVEPEENRAHMTSYINFEEDALGDEEILGERDTDYFRDREDDYYADAKDCGQTDSRIPQPVHDDIPGEPSHVHPLPSNNETPDHRASPRDTQNKHRNHSRDTREDARRDTRRDAREDTREDTREDARRDAHNIGDIPFTAACSEPKEPKRQPRFGIPKIDPS
jgi:hypothetical protein